MKPIASKENLYYYNPVLQKYARTNKGTLTKSAACMWKYVLKGSQMRGYRFRRERPVLQYIADFACLPLLLIIEVDGITHQGKENQVKDRTRDQALAEIGFTTLRFTSHEVLNQIERVRTTIANWIIEKEEELNLDSPVPRRGGAPQGRG